MVDPRWLECDTCLNCRREESQRYCEAQSKYVERPLIVECEFWREIPGLPPHVQEMLARRYCGLY